MGWTEAEELVVVMETGVVHWYSVLGASPPPPSSRRRRLFWGGCCFFLGGGLCLCFLFVFPSSRPPRRRLFSHQNEPGCFVVFVVLSSSWSSFFASQNNKQQQQQQRGVLFICFPPKITKTNKTTPKPLQASAWRERPLRLLVLRRAGQEEAGGSLRRGRPGGWWTRR